MISQRILLTFISLIAFLVVLELSMRVAGHIYSNTSDNTKMRIISKKHNEEFRILCLGDSYTFGLGANKYNSYPEHLERILNEKFPARKYKVYNGGFLGNNSSTVASEDLQKHISEIIPDLIIVMTGCNDVWLLSDRICLYLHKYQNSTFIGTGFKRLGLVLEQLKVYKLIRILFFRIKYHNVNKIIKDGLIDINQSNLGEERVSIENKGLAHMLLGVEFANKKDYGSAKREFKEAIKDPVFIHQVIHIEWIFSFLCRVTQGDSKELAKEVNDLEEIIKAQYDFSVYEKIKEIFDMLLFLISDMDIPRGILRYDLIKIYKIANKNHINLVLQTYPCFVSGMNETIKSVSCEFNIPLVDNYTIFKENLLTYQEKDLFVPDGHCNAEGYKLVAKNVYDTLISHNLIPR